jgi:MCP family monocarboxylic acid transporter-like MFS transporter 10
MYGSMMLFRGIGNILSTPISAALLSGVDPNKLDLSTIGSGTALGGAFKGQYEKVIVYAGTCFAAAALVVVVGWVVNGRSARRGSARLAQHD